MLGNVTKQLREDRQASQPPVIQNLNEQIKGFQFVELLGKGGAGWTFLAIQESLSREVAVKVIDRNSNRFDEPVARFQREAESLARLNHPGIVAVHDFGSTGDFHYLVMEFVPGPTLRQRITNTQTTVEQSLVIVQQICDAVQYAHDSGILHRDIKPENILFASDAPDANVKVADFGIAQIFSRDELEPLTRTGFVSGTPYYMAPEQTTGLREATPGSDVYAIAVVLYELLTGRLPIGRFPPPSQFAKCDRRVDRAVLGALENQSTKRTPTPKLLAENLNRKQGSGIWIVWLLLGLIAMVFAIQAWTMVSGQYFVPQTTQPTESKVPGKEAADEEFTNDKEVENPFLKEWASEDLE